MFSDSRQALLAFVVILSLCSFSFGTTQAEVLMPADTKVSIELLSPISTASGKKGDKFSCKVLTPVEYADAIVEGHIRSVKRSGKANKDSKIDLAFNRIALADGRLADFNAMVVEVFDVPMVGDQGRADNEGLIRNKSTTVKTSIKRAAIGALIGAIVGGAVAGGQGAAVGAAIGAGFGVTTTLATKGPDLEFKTGTQFTVVTNGPIRRRAYSAGEAEVARPPDAQTTANTTAAPNSLTGPVAYKPPPLPSSRLRTLTAPEFNASIPENWLESSKNPLIVSPEGAYKLNNGRPEFTHGAMSGVVNVGSKDLKEASERFVQAILKGNGNGYRKISSGPSSLGLRASVITMLSGKVNDGLMESVTIHTTVLDNGTLFYLITVVPEEEAVHYTEAFNTLVQSLQFHK